MSDRERIRELEAEVEGKDEIIRAEEKTLASFRAEVERLKEHGEETGALLLEGHAAGCRYAAQVTELEAKLAKAKEALEVSLPALEISGTDEAEMARLVVYPVLAALRGEEGKT